MSTMGAALLGAVEHDELRKFTFPLSKLIIFADFKRMHAPNWPISYWESAAPRQCWVFSARLPLLQCWFSAAMSALFARKSTLKKEGRRAAANFVFTFPIVKSTQHAIFIAKNRKINAFMAEALAKMERLNSSCFHWFSRAQKSGSHSRHRVSHPKKI